MLLQLERGIEAQPAEDAGRDRTQARRALAILELITGEIYDYILTPPLYISGRSLLPGAFYTVLLLSSAAKEFATACQAQLTIYSCRHNLQPTDSAEGSSSAVQS